MKIWKFTHSVEAWFTSLNLNQENLAPKPVLIPISSKTIRKKKSQHMPYL